MRTSIPNRQSKNHPLLPCRRSPPPRRYPRRVSVQASELVGRPPRPSREESRRPRRVWEGKRGVSYGLGSVSRAKNEGGRTVA